MALCAIEVDAGYSAALVLRRVSCAVEPGRVTALVGPNGAGKSTLLRVLLGAIEARAGRVELDGVAVRRLAVRDRASRLALVPQSATTGTGYSALQTVVLGRLAFHEPSARVREIALAALERLEIADRADRPLGSLSAGEQQRVLLARALAQLTLVDAAGSAPADRASRFILADEPVASMDPRHALASMGVLREAASRGVGVLVVVHDFALAARFADDAIVMGSGGSLAARGAAPEVLRPPVLGGVFESDFAMVGGIGPVPAFALPVGGSVGARTGASPHTLASP